jgi:hypothetical protein
MLQLSFHLTTMTSRNYRIISTVCLASLPPLWPRVSNNGIVSFIPNMQSAGCLGMNLALKLHVILHGTNANLRHDMQIQNAQYIQARRSAAAHIFHCHCDDPLLLPKSSILKLNAGLPLVSSLHLPMGLRGLFLLFSASIS